MRRRFAAWIVLATLWVAGPAHAQLAADAKPWLGLLRPQQGAFGVLILEVYEDSGAAAAGLIPGDEILFIDDIPVTSVPELVMVVGGHDVGDVVGVRALRRGVELSVRVTLGARVEDRELLHRRLVGKAAPAAMLEIPAEARQLDPSALRGRVAVLAWFSTRCDLCGALVSELARWPALRREALVAAVTTGEPDRIATYLARSALAVPLAVAQGEAFEQYSLLPSRSDTAVAFIVIDRNGVIRVAAAIDTADLDAAQPSVDDIVAAARGVLRDKRW